jgi:NAD(P)-dependent dehydrogenase (short-subunit alcohol dehydrogenase family)
MTQKVILITGASAGIGRACADLLQSAGWTVVGASRRGTSSGSWQGLTMDVEDDASVSQGFSDVIAEHGRLDAVLACAGWGLAGAAELTPIEDAKAQLETNFWGVVRTINAALPIFRPQGSGRIIIVGSICGVIGIPYQSFYCASKYALEGYGESLAYEVEPFGVRVTIVEPGNIKTEFTRQRRNVALPGDDPYKVASDKAIGTMERDEMNGSDPRVVARAIERLLNAKNPPRRVAVGKFGERLGVIAKRVMPFALFEKSARRALGV